MLTDMTFQYTMCTRKFEHRMVHGVKICCEAWYMDPYYLRQSIADKAFADKGFWTIGVNK